MKIHTRRSLQGISSIIFVFVVFMPILSLAGTVDLPKTGQITSHYFGDDGHFQVGVVWPSPRFTDNEDGTVKDNLTGLIWLANGNCMADHYSGFDNDATAGDGRVTWHHALDFVAGINAGTYSSCGANHTDWRLPNVNEIESLVTAEENVAAWLNSRGFTNVQSENYWSSTTWVTDPNGAWLINMESGAMFMLNKFFESAVSFVLPVRGETSGPAQVWRTGQIESYTQGDDGDIQAGVSWPDPRFTDNGDGTVKDNLTGLIWLQDGFCFEAVNWRDALEKVMNFNANPESYACQGYTADYSWRLPNRKEYNSLTDFSQSQPSISLPMGHPFKNVFGFHNWSSTSYAIDAEKAWFKFMENGHVDGFSKDSTFPFFLVRAETVPIPDSVGQDQAEAEATLSAYGLTVGAITTRHSASIPHGQVMSQSPAAGMEVAVGTSVDLVVSIGPEELVLVTVPNTVNQTQAQAGAALRAVDLAVGSITSQHHASIASGRVISQSQAAGSQIASGTAVDLTVSSGPAPVTVPNTIGQTQAQAAAALMDAGLAVGSVSSQQHASIASGRVISQSQPAGSQVAPATAVDLLVSSGPEEPSLVVVPNTVNQTRVQAEAALTAAGLTLGSVTSQHHAAVADGRVISQSLSASSQVAPGTAVNLIISNGPAPVTVPNTVDQTRAQAEAALTAAGLTLGSVTAQPHATIADGRVISQSLPTGSQVAPSTAVNLIISNGPAPVTVPNTINQTRAQAEAAITVAGLTLGSITAEHHDIIADGRVSSQSLSAGSQVASGTAVSLIISSGPAWIPLPPQLTVSPNDSYPVLVDSGDGTPNPLSRTYVLSNPGGTVLEYRISTTAPWLDLSRTEGRLEAGAEISVAVSANAQVDTLAPNELHQAEVRFDNLSNGTGSTVRTATAFILADVGWGVSRTEGFDDNSSLAAVDIPPETTAVLRFLVDRPATRQVGIAAASIPDLNLGFQQRRRGMGPQDSLTASINDEPVGQWFGDSDWERSSVSLDTCPGFPCEITFAFQERQDRSETSGAVYLDNLGIAPDVQPYASVLPGSRSASVGQSVTAFATLINAGTALGEGCALRPVTPVSGEFSYQTADSATNELMGIANVPRDIPADAAQSFVFAFIPDAALAPTDVELRFDCSNSGPADVVIGLNTFLLSASAQPVPDIVALGATIDRDGIVKIPGGNGTGVFSVASVNVGTGGVIRVAADTGRIELLVRLLLCETDPLSGACFQAPANEVDTEIAANATPTFGIFVESTGEVPFDPAAHRVFVRFRDQAGVVRGATSVAVRTQ